MNKKTKRKLQFLLGFILLNAAGAALLGSRLFAQYGTAGYSGMATASIGANYSRSLVVTKVIVLLPCGGGALPGGATPTNVDLCAKIVDASSLATSNNVVRAAPEIYAEWTVVQFPSS